MQTVFTLIALAIASALAVYLGYKAANDPSQDFLGFQSRRDERRPSSERLRFLRDEHERFYRRSFTCTDPTESQMLSKTAQSTRNALTKLRREDDALQKAVKQYIAPSS